MSKRYYICNIVGDGLEPETAFRPAIADAADDFAAPLPTDVTGRPVKTWTLAIVGAQDHAVFAGKSGIDPLPGYALNKKLTPTNVTVLKNALGARGISSSHFDNADEYKKALQGIGMQLDENFDIDKLDCNDS